jgi:hypothetical protein
MRFALSAAGLRRLPPAARGACLHLSSRFAYAAGQEAHSLESIGQRYPECQALCTAANEAAGGAQGVWFAFMGYGAFLTVAVSSTTGRMLLMETPISLPLLSIELNLVGFYIAAPLLLVVLHLYLMIKLVLLSETYVNFERQVARDIPDDADREQMRLHLNTTVFLQALKGRGGSVLLLAALLIATVVVGPIVLLLLTEVVFLRYQSEVVTTFHRGLIVADVVVVLGAYEAALRNGAGRVSRPGSGPAGRCASDASKASPPCHDERRERRRGTPVAAAPSPAARSARRPSRWWR